MVRQPDQPQQQQLEPEADEDLGFEEALAAGDLVVSDSGSDSEQGPAEVPQQAQQAQQQQQQAQQQQASASPGPGESQLPPPPQQRPTAQQQAQLPTLQKRRGLLQISRVGQPPASSSRWQATAAEQTSAATSGEHRAAAGPADEPAAAATFCTGPPRSRPSAEWELGGQRSHMGRPVDVSPASVASADNSPALPPVGQYDEQGPATSGPSAGPAVDEHFVTSWRAGGGGGARQPTAAAARRSVREWSESDSDEFPTPTGGRQHGWSGGDLTGNYLPLVCLALLPAPRP